MLSSLDGAGAGEILSCEGIPFHPPSAPFGEPEMAPVCPAILRNHGALRGPQIRPPPPLTSGAISMRHRRQLSTVILFASFLVARLHEPALGEAIQLHRVPICSKTLKSCSWSAKITGTIDDGTV